ncbi:hypothetical protein CEXT_287861 [Caerostris extrusa]|uniref:Uncharacterized protein n=1 Tax=Caerostris extrusa TaxID=172846 RepID=A0AAV4STZ3_CAEEX|nr:hypothetical protein CEXT_287861 [Caerostris extrusa]
METAEDEWWRRMERAGDDRQLRSGKCTRASNQNLWIQRVRQYPRSCWPRLHFHESYLKKNAVHSYQL